ncbi:Cell wall-associated hydrolase, NlpC family [Lachnospiraceae bacterium XBB1006]|nr:Cell wall-associated hydrolase, NlpC family [Lachnospiraceae bacterium XBB1006]
MNRARKIATCCLVGGMVLSSAPMMTEASALSGVSTILQEKVNIEDSSIFAGVSGAVADYLTSAAEVNIHSVQAVAASKETEDETEKQAAAEAAKVDAEDVSNLCVAKVDDFVYVRSKANTDSKVRGKLYKKNVATIIGTKGDWYKIKSGKLQGYVSADFVVAGNGEALKSAGTRYAKVNTTTLRVRKKASTNAEIIGLVPQDEDIVVKDEKNGWVKVSVEEGKGWVSTDFVELHTEYTHGETVKEEKARLKKEEKERLAAQAAAEQAIANGVAGTSNAGSSNSGSSGSASGTSSSSGTSTAAPSGSSTGASVASYACRFVGNPYRWGGTSLTNGADCSGFVMSVYRAFGISLPHSSSAMRGVGRGVSMSEMQAGDIICYSGHVAIYIGGGRIVHASNHRDGIKISNSYNYRSVLAVRRIF